MATGHDFSDLRDRLAAALARRCPPWLRDQRDDILQVAMVRLLQVVDRTERTTPFPSSYLWKVAFSAMIDEIRRLRRLRTVPLDENALVLPAAEERSDPERMRSAREAGRAIRACVAALNPFRRRAVTLYLLGHSVPYIGRLMGWNLKKAENLVYRGLDAVRTCLAAKGIDSAEPRV